MSMLNKLIGRFLGGDTDQDADDEYKTKANRADYRKAGRKASGHTPVTHQAGRRRSPRASAEPHWVAELDTRTDAQRERGDRLVEKVRAAWSRTAAENLQLPADEQTPWVTPDQEQAHRNARARGRRQRAARRARRRADAR